ncbi:MAG TPA: hypothetical protein VJP02_21125 [Candidatus Sulfotelmatobacter sp.]|nr:hypothetical protein [Candidatus Sulfotelmatobacter sp.]
MNLPARQLWFYPSQTTLPYKAATPFQRYLLIETFSIKTTTHQAPAGARERSSGLHCGQNVNQIVKVSSSPSSQNFVGKYMQTDPQWVQYFVLGLVLL